MNNNQQLSAHELHPLTKSFGFNSAMLLLAVSSFYLLGGVISLDVGAAIANSRALVAGVGLSDPDEQRGVSAESSLSISAASNEAPNNILPFSNNIVVTEGENEDSIIVQPIFDSGAGRAYEYSVMST